MFSGLAFSWMLQFIAINVMCTLCVCPHVYFGCTPAFLQPNQTKPNQAKSEFLIEIDYESIILLHILNFWIDNKLIEHFKWKKSSRSIQVKEQLNHIMFIKRLIAESKHFATETYRQMIGVSLACTLATSGLAVYVGYRIAKPYLFWWAGWVCSCVAIWIWSQTNQNIWSWLWRIQVELSFERQTIRRTATATRKTIHG